MYVNYKSAFLTDLVACYLLEKTEKFFTNQPLPQILPQWWLLCIQSQPKIEELRNWLQKFQQSINEIRGGTFLQFTMEVWDEFYVSNNDIENDHNKTQKCTLVKKPTFPFLDMSFYWDSFNRLATKAYSKPGQKIQYVNKDSTHRRSCLTAIPSGVFKRLSRLTSQDDLGIAGNKAINELYPDHWNALLEANLVKKAIKPPRMKTLWRRNDNDKNKNEKSNEDNSTYHKHNTRNVYFVHGHSKFWSNLKEPIHKIITKAFKSNNLDWLRIRMTYRRYTNISELLQSDLSKKLNKDLVSLDYMERPCNCPAHCLIDNKCPYGNKCRTTCVVYKVEWKTRKKFYILNTQQAS